MDEMLNELFQTAEDYFKANKYSQAEPLLNQLVMKSARRPEVFHMLGTIYYDQGKFKKAIKSFERALEVDPGFTDSSVGLSIILNDLGRYDEGQKVFEEAKLMLAQKTQTPDAQLNERFAAKHIELGDLYYRHHRAEEALEQFQIALRLTRRKTEVQLQIADCYFELGNIQMCIRGLREVLRDTPSYVPALLRLGKAYYDIHQIPEAVEQWERVLNYEPENRTAQDYLRLVQTVQVTSLNEPHIEL